MKTAKELIYYVSYNAKFIARYKTLGAALRFIERKGLKNDYNNLLYIIDSDGETYDAQTGEIITID